MARRRHRKFLVSTGPIKRELLKAANKLKRMKKKASPAKRRAINLEIALLRDCFEKLDQNIACF